MTTDTAETTDAPTDGATDTTPEVDPAIAEAKQARHDQLWDRFVLPFFLPALCIGFVVLLAINISRLFLAGDKETSLIVVVLLTITLLVGFAAVSAARNMRNVTSTILFGVVVASLLLGGGLTFSSGEPEEAEAVKVGSVPADYAGPITPLRVEALPTLKFDKDQYDVPVGALDVAYYNVGGQHTLVFSDARYSWFELAVNSQGETDAGKIQFDKAGTYEFYCSVPGHKQAGMIANLVVK